ncbi:hypothetical protein BGAPBR_K0006 (plasmid) [Borreliella garinii PBr]|uniref:Uncharacterized protein n=1 Tax=Borreliella garinii PBr TaxID=498743 RepID=B8F0N9_BORGR|nr:hypothetical protein BGAPBR_K0006 [Borreliella garinii PBr]
MTYLLEIRFFFFLELSCKLNKNFVKCILQTVFHASKCAGIIIYLLIYSQISILSFFNVSSLFYFNKSHIVNNKDLGFSAFLSKHLSLPNKNNHLYLTDE